MRQFEVSGRREGRRFKAPVVAEDEEQARERFMESLQEEVRGEFEVENVE